MIRLLLADDENLIRSGLAALLGMKDDLHVVVQAASGDEALAMARIHRPDVAVLDLQMPGLDGIAVAEALRSQVPECASIIVTSYGRPGHLKRALGAGVCGSCPRGSPRTCSRMSCVPCAAAGATSTPSSPPKVHDG